nr:hypothetical protein [Tanacetum cinerariifolium]
MEMAKGFLAELEEFFSDVAPEKVNSNETEKKCPEKIQLIDPSSANSVEIMLTKVEMPLSNMTIDPSRANSVEIMLTKVEMPLSNMTRAILVMDDKILSVDQLESIFKWIPMREAMAKLKANEVITYLMHLL